MGTTTEYNTPLQQTLILALHYTITAGNLTATTELIENPLSYAEQLEDLAPIEQERKIHGYLNTCILNTTNDILSPSASEGFITPRSIPSSEASTPVATRSSTPLNKLLLSLKADEAQLASSSSSSLDSTESIALRLQSTTLTDEDQMVLQEFANAKSIQSALVDFAGKHATENQSDVIEYLQTLSEAQLEKLFSLAKPFNPPETQERVTCTNSS